MNKEGILEKVNSIPLWYHSIDLGQGVTTPGLVPVEDHERRSALIPQDLTGKSVLDIGAWDGYYSFLAEQRGAERVVALDNFSFGEGGDQAGVDRWQYQSINGFQVAREILDSKVEYAQISIYNLLAYRETFDVVFFFEVHHHLKDPIYGFTVACEKCRDLLLIEGDLLYLDSPVLYYEFTMEDPTKAWRFSRELMYQMLKDNGFNSVKERWSILTTPFLFRKNAAEASSWCEAHKVFLECRRD